MTRGTLAVVFLGGLLGSLLRWGLQLLGGGSDLANAGITLAINTGGVFGMAAVAPLLARGSDARRAFVNAGFFGGFTTFSAVMLFTVSARGLANALGGVPFLLVGLGYLAVSFGCAWLAASAGQRVSSARLRGSDKRRRRGRS